MYFPVVLVSSWADFQTNTEGTIQFKFRTLSNKWCNYRMDSYGAQIESNLFEGENKFSCPFMDIIFCYDSIGFFLV